MGNRFCGYPFCKSAEINCKLSEIFLFSTAGNLGQIWGLEEGTLDSDLSMRWSWKAQCQEPFILRRNIEEILSFFEFFRIIISNQTQFEAFKTDLKKLQSTYYRFYAIQSQKTSHQCKTSRQAGYPMDFTSFYRVVTLNTLLVLGENFPIPALLDKQTHISCIFKFPRKNLPSHTPINIRSNPFLNAKNYKKNQFD